MFSAKITKENRVIFDVTATTDVNSPGGYAKFLQEQKKVVNEAITELVEMESSKG